MEFTELGEHCCKCKQLDFCPTKCTDCNNNFCKDHWNIDKHNCLGSKKIKMWMSKLL